LLEWEIETFRPRNIIFTTGDWANDFVKDNLMFSQVPFRAPQFIKCRGRVLVENEQLGRFVVADRPERRKEGCWVKLVLNALKCKLA
jgi:hypothetical protein